MSDAPTGGRRPLVCVVGSLNADTTLSVDALPRPGETVLAGGRRAAAGGKGANQAVAVASAGGRAAMVGAVGDDADGALALAALRGHLVSVEQVRTRADRGTGIAIIAVDRTGENTIIVDPGANATLTAEEVRASVTDLAPAVVLAQLEIPTAAVAAALEAADGAVVVLNPAPVPADPAPVTALLGSVDVLVPNRSELAALAGLPEPGDVSGVERCLAALDFDGDVVVTLGADGLVHRPRGAGPVHVPGVDVEAVDATGAGDVFCGTLAQALADGVGLAAAVVLANEAAAASTTWRGAQPAL